MTPTTPVSLPSPAALVFDLDGTLVDSHAGIAASVRHTLSTFGFAEPAPEVLRVALSLGLRPLLATLTGETEPARIETYAETYLAHYERTMIETSPPLPGVPEMLEGLSARGLPLAVLTNKSERNARRIVEARFGGDRFRTLVGLVAGRPQKPDPTGARLVLEQLGVHATSSWLVGDSVLDVRTARNAAMVAIGVTWGIDESLHGALADADRVASRPEALVRLVDEALAPGAG